MRFDIYSPFYNTHIAFNIKHLYQIIPCLVNDYHRTMYDSGGHDV